MKKITPLTQQKLKQLLHYDPNSGEFTWLNPTGPRRRRGDRAGHISSGTIMITIDKKQYRANRLAWLYMVGEWSSCDIKPINGLPDDIRWGNLKLGTRKRI